jgi:hypothetical protein
MRATIIFLFTLALLLSNGCYYDNAEELYPNSFCDTTNVTYSNTIEPIVMAKCAIPGCHVAGGGGNWDFTVFENVAAKVADGRFLASVKRAPGVAAMPPDAVLPPCEVRQIEIWIDSGAPNN